MQISAGQQVRPVGQYLHGLLSTSIDLSLAVSEDGAAGDVSLQLDPALERLGDEGYTLSIAPDRVSIRALSLAGVFYGVQTLRQLLLRQLLPVEVEGGGDGDAAAGSACSLPCVQIEDYPRFSWRGYMLDEGRHFHGKEVVKQLVDLLALQKMNVFHWHLTEDQGWRIEIEKYPRLTKVGSRRRDTQVEGFASKKRAGAPHAGFYSQEEIKEIVAYAAERFVTVVPEIDMPGHSLAALAAYPELSCTGGPFEVSETFGVHKDIYCVGKERTFEFVEGVLDEVLPLFPSPVIHIGGDEAPRSRWKACPDCQARMRSEGLANEHELQGYFTNRIAAYLAAQGRRLMGWNEILSDDLAEDAIGQYWIRGWKTVLEHLKRGRQIVMSNWFYAYLDHDYDFTSLRKAYAYDPVPKNLPGAYHGNVLGLEGLLWTEWVSTEGRLHWQTFPRLTALAETGWTPREGKDWADFERRLAHFLQYLDALGVGYAGADEREPGLFRRIMALFRIAKAPTGGER
jgi:hexosaminidase